MSGYSKFHAWDGHRVYDGCPDSTMQRRLDHEQQLLNKLKEKHPEAHLTYFPYEERWMAHIWGKPLTDMIPTRLTCLEAALERSAP